jgi:hypothetical protein
MKFPSTNLAQSSDPKDIQKADLDLLDKINQVQAAIDATNAAIAKLNIPSVGGLAPLPQTAAGVGQWVSVISAANGAVSLPAGGTWAYMAWILNNTTGAMFAPGAVASGILVGIAAGGTQLIAGQASFYAQALAWRIA